MRNVYGLIVIIFIAIYKPALADDIEYAIRIKNSTSEYGTKLPKELCAKSSASPCVMSTDLLMLPVQDFNKIKANLSGSAWSALKRHASQGQETWSFNLCKRKWKQGEVCAEVNGYVVMKHYNAIFYAFYKDWQCLTDAPRSTRLRRATEARR